MRRSSFALTVGAVASVVFFSGLFYLLSLRDFIEAVTIVSGIVAAVFFLHWIAVSGDEE